MKAPKEPKSPKMPFEPKPPEQFTYKNKQSLKVAEDCGRHGTIPFSDLVKLRSQIEANDDCINLVITSTSSYCGCDDYESEIESVYFEWYQKEEDPSYPRRLEKYKEDLKKYYADKAQYEAKREQYAKDMKEYQKQLKAYKLESMKEQKARLEAQIAKAERKSSK